MIEEALAPDYRDRYESMSQFLEALSKAAPEEDRRDSPEKTEEDREPVTQPGSESGKNRIAEERVLGILEEEGKAGEEFLSGTEDGHRTDQNLEDTAGSVADSWKTAGVSACIAA